MEPQAKAGGHGSILAISAHPHFHSSNPLRAFPAKPIATGEPFVAASYFRAATSIMATMPARIASGNVGQASISRAKSA
jgi:hypothetical protein